MPTINVPSLTYKKFTGGLVTSRSESEIEREQTPEMKNLLADQEILSQRSGFRKWSTAYGPTDVLKSPMMGGKRYYFRSGSTDKAYTVIASSFDGTNGSIAIYDETNNIWVPPTTNVTWTGVSSKVEFEEYNGKLYFRVDGQGYGYVYDGATGTWGSVKSLAGLNTPTTSPSIYRHLNTAEMNSLSSDPLYDNDAVYNGVWDKTSGSPTYTLDLNTVYSFQGSGTCLRVTVPTGTNGKDFWIAWASGAHGDASGGAKYLTFLHRASSASLSWNVYIVNQSDQEILVGSFTSSTTAYSTARISLESVSDTYLINIKKILFRQTSTPSITWYLYIDCLDIIGSLEAGWHYYVYTYYDSVSGQESSISPWAAKKMSGPTDSDGNALWNNAYNSALVKITTDRDSSVANYIRIYRFHWDLFTFRLLTEVSNTQTGGSPVTIRYVDWKSNLSLGAEYTAPAPLPYGAKTLKVHKNRMFYSGMDATPSDSVVSEWGIPYRTSSKSYLDASGREGGTLYIDRQNMQGVVAMCSLGSVMAFMKTNSCYLLYGDDFDDFQVRQMSNVIGICGQRAFANCEGFLAWVYGNDVWLSNGSDAPTSIGRDIEDQLAQVTATQKKEISCAYFDRRLYVAVPSLLKIFVYDFRYENWSYLQRFVEDENKHFPLFWLEFIGRGDASFLGFGTEGYYNVPDYYRFIWKIDPSYTMDDFGSLRTTNNPIAIDWKSRKENFDEDGLYKRSRAIRIRGSHTSTTGTLNSNLNATDDTTNIIVTAGTIGNFGIRQSIKIDSEYMYITGINTGTYTITATRGMYSSTKTTHSIGATIYIVNVVTITITGDTTWTKTHISDGGVFDTEYSTLGPKGKYLQIEVAGSVCYGFKINEIEVWAAKLR